MRTEVLKLRLTRKAQWTCLGLAAAVGMGLIFQPTAAHAIAGACVSCHTMHNSQNATAMATDSAGNPDFTANDYLLLGVDCLACHTGTNAIVAGVDTTPYVHDTIAPTYGLGDGGTLAGGSFYWTAAAGFGDASGHNVVGIAGLDISAGTGTGLVPPGGNTLASQLTCAGTTGCHGDRLVTGDMAAINGSHHGNVNGALYGATVADSGSSYRFLDGVNGFEDPDYETTAASGTTDHNGYYGTARATDTVINPETISSLCAQCHPGFHNTTAVTGMTDPGIQGTAWGSPWVRHPTDFDMAAATGAEYASYGGATNLYQIEAPLANPTAYAAQAAIMDTAVMAEAGGAIVTCISCHRAHGSPYPDALRWSYSQMTVNNAGVGAGTGCFHCHTAKDGI